MFAVWNEEFLISYIACIKPTNFLIKIPPMIVTMLSHPLQCIMLNKQTIRNKIIDQVLTEKLEQQVQNCSLLKSSFLPSDKCVSESHFGCRTILTLCPSKYIKQGPCYL